MKTLNALIVRNIKLYFKDKGLFFSSLITPLILLLLYVTFLGNVYRDSFTSAMPEYFSVPEKLINGTVGTQLFSSLLAVSCVTVAFCSNLIMIQDKFSGAIRDLRISPLRRSTLALSYYLATVANSLLICLVASGACFIYLAVVGWYLSVLDVLLILLDVFLLTMFGTALSSIVYRFLSTQGQASAAGTIISSCYGFVCGAYMPISQFGEGLQKVLSFLPGTYGTSLLRNHVMRGVFAEMSAQGFPDEVVAGIRKSVDCDLTFFGHTVGEGMMYAILAGSVAVLVGVYVLINLWDAREV